MRQRHDIADVVRLNLSAKMCRNYENRSGAGAISLDTPISYWTSTGAAQALTLADGEDGQEKTVVHAVDGGSIAITPTNFGGATSATVTLATAGDSVTFTFLNGAWWVTAFASNAAITGSTVTYS